MGPQFEAIAFGRWRVHLLLLRRQATTISGHELDLAERFGRERWQSFLKRGGAALGCLGGLS